MDATGMAGVAAVRAEHAEGTGGQAALSVHRTVLSSAMLNGHMGDIPAHLEWLFRGLRSSEVAQTKR